MVTGGRRAEGVTGRFFEPTVLAEVDHSMRCMMEETFGPTLPVMRVHDATEAIRLANEGPYGLQASVWTRDAEAGERLARRIEAGVCVRQRRTGQLRRPRAADGRLEGLRAGIAARARWDPQVRQAPVAAGDARLRPGSRGPHASLLRRGHAADRPGVQRPGGERSVHGRPAEDAVGPLRHDRPVAGAAARRGGSRRVLGASRVAPRRSRGDRARVAARGAHPRSRSKACASS